MTPYGLGAVAGQIQRVLVLVGCCEGGRTGPKIFFSPNESSTRMMTELTKWYRERWETEATKAALNHSWTPSNRQGITPPVRRELCHFKRVE